MLKFFRVEPADPWVRTDPTDEHTLYEKAEEHFIYVHKQTNLLRWIMVCCSPLLIWGFVLKYLIFTCGKSEVWHLLLPCIQYRMAEVWFLHSALRGTFFVSVPEQGGFVCSTGKRPFSQYDCIAHRSKENRAEKEWERPSNPLPCFMGRSMLSN